MNITTLGWWFGERIEPEEVGIYVIYHSCRYEDVISRLKECANAFVQTERGKKVLAHNNGEFNWGDVAVHIHTDFLQRYGILHIETPYSYGRKITVNHDERVID